MNDDRVAVITGAERGLGRAVARQLAARGMMVVPTSRELEPAEKVVKELEASGGRGRAYRLDVTDDGSVEEFTAKLVCDLGRVDILINNAGILIDTNDTPSCADIEIVRQTLETNLFGAWRMTSRLLPLMKQGDYGRIVNISSVMGQLENMGTTSPAYRVSKAALNALTGMIAAETAGTNIQVNSVDPGWMRTAMGGPEAPRSVDKGAETVVWLATESKGKTGCFMFDRKLIPW